MKLEKIYEMAKEYLEALNGEGVKKKKVKELQEEIEEKISKLKKKAKNADNEEEAEGYRKEIGALKEILTKLDKKDD
ncbi:MAG: hypothetical protein WHU93_07630 [Arcobacteraceae bacterium]